MIWLWMARLGVTVSKRTVQEDGMKSPCAMKLHNVVTVSQQRLGKRVAQLSSARMNEVCAALRFSLGCDSS
jgi:mRNA-degrading endonuclease toxin of MazEF toxin-antitoxin module